jgi:hypothetical protein
MVCELTTSPTGGTPLFVGEVPGLLSLANCGGGGGVAVFMFNADAGTGEVREVEDGFDVGYK